MRRIIGAVAIAMAVSAPAAAQEGARSFVRGLGGITFGTERAAVLGGGVGVRVAPNVQIYFEGGYITSILPTDALDIVEAVLDDLDQPFADLTINAPSTYGLFGARFEMGSGGGARPFAEALFGFARTTAEFSVTIGGISFDLDDLPVDLGLASTEAAVAFGGGVVVPIGGRAGVELGYRWMRVLIEEAANVSKVYAAVRIAL